MNFVKKFFWFLVFLIFLGTFFTYFGIDYLASDCFLNSENKSKQLLRASFVALGGVMPGVWMWFDHKKKPRE